MLAAIYRTAGAAEDVLLLEEVPDPQPGPEEVRVRVHVSAVNPTDVKARRRPSTIAWDWKIPNQDGAGVIDLVGPGVDLGRLGERVWLYHAAYRRQGGTAAQYVCVPQAQAVALPPGVDLEQAAGLGVPFLTAFDCLQVAGPIADQEVLVTGGAGAVGNAAIQLARFLGARVLATVSSPYKADLARRAGATAIIDYRREDVASRLAEEVGSALLCVVDVDVVANLPVYVDALAERSTISAYASAPQAIVDWPVQRLRERNVTLNWMLIYGIPDERLRAAVAGVSAALEVGALAPLVSHRFELEEIAAAHAAVEDGIVGKVLLRVP